MNGLWGIKSDDNIMMLRLIVVTIKFSDDSVIVFRVYIQGLVHK